MWSFKKTAFNYRLTIEKVIIDLVGRTNISNQNKDSKNKSKKQENTDNKKVKQNSYPQFVHTLELKMCHKMNGIK